MKDKPITIVVTLLGGAIAALSCLINGADLFWTLTLVLISLVAFLIIGMVVNRIYTRIKDDIDRREAEERARREYEAAEEERRMNEEALARKDKEAEEDSESEEAGENTTE